MSDADIEPSKNELKERVAQLEEAVAPMLHSRRDLLKGAAGGAAAAGVLGFGAGSASAQADANDSVGDVGTPSSPVDVFGDGITANSAGVGDLGGAFVDVSTYSGATLAQKVEAAVADTSRSIYYIPRDNDGAVWEWDSAIDIDLTNSTLLGAMAIVEHTVTSGNGPLLRFNGNRATVRGLSFGAAASQTPDVGIEMYGNSQMTIEKCFVRDVERGVGSGGTGSPFRMEIRDCRVNATTGDAYYYEGGASTSGLVNSYAAAEIGGHGVSITGGTGMYIEGGTFDNCDDNNVSLVSSEAYSVRNISIEQDSDVTAMFAADSASTGMVVSPRFTDNSSGSPRAMQFLGGAHVVITPNFTNDIGGAEIQLFSTTSGGSLGDEQPVLWLYGTPGVDINDGTTDAPMINGVTEEASSGVPTPANYPIGAVVEDTNNAGDLYMKALDGTMEQIST